MSGPGEVPGEPARKAVECIAMQACETALEWQAEPSLFATISRPFAELLNKDGWPFQPLAGGG